MAEEDWAGYRTFDRREWSALRAATPMSLGADELEDLRGLNERLGFEEVTEVYLPLSRLLNLRVAATQGLHRTTDTFLGRPLQPVPFIIGLGGSVAVGKSTTARVLQALLARWPDHPNVELVTTDGFLRPNRCWPSAGSWSARASRRATTCAGSPSSSRRSSGANPRCERPSTPTSSTTSWTARSRSCASPTS